MDDELERLAKRLLSRGAKLFEQAGVRRLEPLPMLRMLFDQGGGIVGIVGHHAHTKRDEEKPADCS